MTGSDLRRVMIDVLMNGGDFSEFSPEEVADSFSLPPADALPPGNWALVSDDLYDCFSMPPGLSAENQVLVDADGALCVAGFERHCMGVLFYFRFAPA